jgi:hypothetical protein
MEPKEREVAIWEMRPGQPSPTLADFAALIRPNATYGATASLLMNVFEPTGVKVRFTDVCDLDGLRAAVAQAEPGAPLR